MKGKLIKRGEGFILLDDKSNEIGQTFGKFKGKKLSIKNCQAIENGYDLDELADKYSDKWDAFTDDRFDAFKQGFQKAMELMEGKKYSEEDIEKAFDAGWIQRQNEEGSHYEALDNFIQSLHPKEWEVEILEELDKDGCLILKRI